MLEKYKLLFSSTRFWQYALAITLYILLSNGYITNESIETTLSIVAMLSATSATVGTVDRFAEQM